jgi:hypothetical protein
LLFLVIFGFAWNRADGKTGSTLVPSVVGTCRGSAYDPFIDILLASRPAPSGREAGFRAELSIEWRASIDRI